MPSEQTFLQTWLGGTFGHVDGDLDFLNADGSAIVTTGDYAEIVQFIEEQEEVFIDLVAGELFAGFALQFPDDGNVEAGVFAPSFAIRGNGYRWDVYLTDASDGELRGLIDELQPQQDDTYTVERLIPLPINNFEMSDADADRATEGYRVFTLEEIEAVFFAPVEEPAAPATEPSGHINDAEIWGDVTPEMQALEVAISTAKNREAKEWTTHDPKPFMDIFQTVFSKHVAGKKDGNSVVLGALGQQTKRRTKTNVIRNSMMGLDIDSGASMEETFQRVRKMGLAAIFYTTHSHGSTEIEIAYDKFYRWALKNEIEPSESTELIRRYMREETNYVSDVCDHSEFVEKRHEDGMKLILRTRPIDKFRVIFPLKEAFVYAQQQGAHKDVIHQWELKVLGMGRSIGVEIDRVARDPSRLFYLPRHGKDSTNHRIMLTCGKLVAYEDVPAASTTSRVSDDPFDQAAAIMGGTMRGRTMSPTLGLDLGQWAKDHAHEFDIASVFRDHCSDRIRVEQTQDKLTVECPFDDDHSNPGDPDDPGCFIQSAGMEAESFAFHCSHAGCAGRNRLVMLQKAMQEDWFPDNVLNDKVYLVESEDEEEEKTKDDAGPDADDDEVEDKAYSDRHQEAVEAISKISKEAKRSQIKEVYELVATLNRSDRGQLAKTLAKKLGLVKDDVIAHINSLRSSGAVEVDDETPDPASVVKNLKRRYKAFKNSKKPIVPQIDANMKGSIDYFVDTVSTVNDQKPMLFLYGSEKIRCVRSTNNEFHPETLSKPVMRSVAIEELDVVEITADGTVNRKAVNDVMAEQACMSTRLKLHKLDGYSDLPYFTREGKLVTTPGYDRDGRRILRLSENAESAYAPDKLLPVTAENLRLAKDEIRYVFSDFPFKDAEVGDGGASSYCHLLAMMLQPLVRSMFDGNSPFYMVNKPMAGTGATLMVTTAMHIATGTNPGTVAMSHNDEELRKAITARFQTGTNVTFFDNLTQPLSSPHLANLATSAEWEDRILGQTTMTKIPNRMQVIVAGNSVRTSEENTRRVLPIFLDTLDDPTERKGFKINDLKGYVEENREELFKYLILLVQYWLQNRPAGWDYRNWKGFKLPSFEQYCAVMGSIMETIGVEGFGVNCKYVRAENSDRQAWNVFLGEVASKAKITALVPFVESKPFTQHQMAGWFVDWENKMELRVNGQARPLQGIDVDDVNRDFSRLVPGIQNNIFKIMWEEARDHHVEVKVRLHVGKDAKGAPLFTLRRVGESAEAA
ncbi:hypothetical protein KEU06_08900 [Pseudaminobacter sp. 19-2017]|uniref:Uncharacterized protein n=1 Tax=Pseudaminobacter soli (ex Zhang et al. 2022) TaxID=2831468 RepID=A0A942E0G6_9HYPH|nr:hypothetical protein [Pseudaminobacter soli]MBS3648746.1 hypothetical protein [Pseudaminobacter soli]